MQRPHPRCPPCTGKPCSGRKISAGADRGATLILGAVIAGGRSSRFGSDKAEALLDGVPLLDHAAAAIRHHVDAVVLVGRERAGWACIADRPHPGLGPLGGIAAALHHAAAHGYDRVLTIGCDMPRVPGELIDALIETAPAYCGEAPILGCWPASAAIGLDSYLGASTDEPGTKNPRFSIRRWAMSMDAEPIAASTPILNINTPADLTLFPRSP